MSRAANREEIRFARSYITAENKKWPAHLLPVPAADWPKQRLDAREKLVGLFRCATHLVQVYEAPAPALVRLSIQRTMIDDQGEWVQGITWDDLQRLKSQAGYGAFDAIEVYPVDRDVVNVANIRHLWVMQSELPFKWTKK